MNTKKISKVVIAVDSFKGSMSAERACEAIMSGISAVNTDIKCICIPMADGGEGTSIALAQASGGEIVKCQVTGPLGEKVEGFWGHLGGIANTAAIEMAAASGLPMVPTDKRNPLHTTTYGTGELILNALDSGAKKLIVCLGGSATNDLGCGMAQALGVKFIDKAGALITKPMTGHLLGEVGDIDLSDLDRRLKSCEVQVACDVDNPLLGPRGASYTFAPQKGATEKIVRQLETNLAAAAKIIESRCGIDICNIPGAGAAGGLGAAMVAFCGGKLTPGIDIVLQASDFAKKIENAELIITGEGKIDKTTLDGKTISGICRAAADKNIPVIAMAGLVADREKLSPLNLTEAVQIAPPEMPVEQAMAQGAKLLKKATIEVFNNFIHG